MNQVDPVLLADRLENIPYVSNQILTPARLNSGATSVVESPPYGAAQIGGNNSLFQLLSTFKNVAHRGSGLNSSGSLTPQSIGPSQQATPTLRPAACKGNGADMQSLDSQMGLIAKLNEIKEQLDSCSSGGESNGSSRGDVESQGVSDNAPSR